MVIRYYVCWFKKITFSPVKVDFRRFYGTFKKMDHILHSIQQSCNFMSIAFKYLTSSCDDHQGRLKKSWGPGHINVSGAPQRRLIWHLICTTEKHTTYPGHLPPAKFPFFKCLKLKTTCHLEKLFSKYFLPIRHDTFQQTRAKVTQFNGHLCGIFSISH